MAAAQQPRAAMANLAEASRAWSHMRTEQQMIRDWVEARPRAEPRDQAAARTPRRRAREELAGLRTKPRETFHGPRPLAPQRIRLQLLAGLRRRAVDAAARHRLPALGVHRRASSSCRRRSPARTRRWTRSPPDRRAQRLAALESSGSSDLDDQDARQLLQAGLASTEGERDRMKGLYEGLANSGNDAQDSAATRDRSTKALESEKSVSSCALARSSLLNQQISRAAPPARCARGGARRLREGQGIAGRIADLGSRLNVALAQRVQELSKLPLRILRPAARQSSAGRADIRVVGDRFVFQSEVFFDTGQAVLKPEGRGELDKLAAASSSISGAKCRRTCPGSCVSTATPTTARSARRNSRRTGACRPRAPSPWSNTSSARASRPTASLQPASASSSPPDRIQDHRALTGPNRPSMPLGDLDQVAAGVVEDRCRDRAEMDRRL
jgi:outer membrane protein OmpA-like peptidoglycan-associated protein